MRALRAAREAGRPQGVADSPTPSRPTGGEGARHDKNFHFTKTLDIQMLTWDVGMSKYYST
jgi:hypothetical protein